MIPAGEATPQGRPAARSDAAAGRVSEDIAQAEACARTASAEFRRRREQWIRAPGGIQQDAAQRNLTLWLAIAAAAGCAELPHGHPARVDELEWYRAEALWPDPHAVHPVRPCDIAPTADWHAELLRARDVLLARAWQPAATEEQRTRAGLVAHLARHLRVEHRLTPPKPANPEERIAA